METSNIKFNSGKQYRVTTADEIIKLVDTVSNGSIYDSAVATHAIKFGFGFSESNGIDFIVSVELEENYELSHEMQDAWEEVAVFAIKDVTMEVNHQVIRRDESLESIDESFGWAMKSTIALRKLLENVDLVIIPIVQLS